MQAARNDQRHYATDKEIPLLLASDQSISSILTCGLTRPLAELYVGRIYCRNSVLTPFVGPSDYSRYSTAEPDFGVGSRRLEAHGEPGAMKAKCPASRRRPPSAYGITRGVLSGRSENPGPAVQSQDVADRP